jgi:hypothetical protein
MGVMILGASIAAVAVVLGCSVWALRRRDGSEAHSVDEYRHTLDTLQVIRSRSAGGSVRVLRGDRAPGPRPSRQMVGTPSPRASGALLPDDGEGGAAGRSGRTGKEGRPGGRRPGGRDQRDRVHSEERAMSAMNHRPRHLAGPALAAVLVLALVLALAAVGAHSRRAPRNPSSRAGHSTALHGDTGSPGTGRTGAGGRAPHHRRSPTLPKSSTPTTTPSAYRASGRTDDSATYVPPHGTYTVDISAPTAQCWVMISNSSGTTLFAATLSPGQRHIVDASGATSVLLGAPTFASVTLDGKPVILPSPLVTPFTLEFLPATAATSPASPATTTAGTAGTADP